MKTGSRLQIVGGREDHASEDRRRWLAKMNQPHLVRAARRGEFYFPLFWRRRSPEEDRGLPLSAAQLRGALLILLPPIILLAAWLFHSLGWIR